MSIQEMLMNPDFQVGLLGAGAPRSSPTNLAGGFSEAVNYMQNAQAARSQQAMRQAQENRLQQDQDMKMQQYQKSLNDEAGLRAGISPLINQENLKPADLNRQIAFQLLNHGDPAGGIKLLTGGGANRIFAPSNVEKQLRLEGLDPESPEGQARARELMQRNTIEGQNELITNRATAQQQTNASKQVNESDKALMQLNQDVLQAAPTFSSKLDQIENIVNSIPGWDLGATVGSLSSKFSADVQKFVSAANDSTLDLKKIKNFPNSGFSDADLNFLKEIIGNPHTTKEAILYNIGRLKQQGQVNINRALRMSDYYHTNNGSLQGFEQSEPYYKTPSGTSSALTAPSGMPSVGLLGGSPNQDTTLDYGNLR